MMKATTMTSSASRHVKWSEMRRSYQLKCASARWPVTGGGWPAVERERTGNRPRSTGHSSFLLRDRDQHLEKVDRFAHVVNADERRAAAVSRRDGRQRSH